MELRGPQRREQIQQIAETLKRTPGIKASAVFIMEGPDDCTRLYYGTYHRQTDPKTRKRPVPKRMRRDLEFIKQLGGAPGEYYFLHATKVRVPTPDVGPPEWALSTVDGVYTLQVAAFEPAAGFWQYKQAAADYCAWLRDKGHEAYYHHSREKVISMVTVGSFGPEAVRKASDGRTYYSREVTELQQSDELLKYNRVNGGIFRVRSGDGDMVPVPSRLVKTPQHEDDGPW